MDINCSVSSGGHDHFVGAITAGALKHGTLTDSMGTAESLTVFMDQPLEDKRIGKLGYTQGVIYVDKPYYYFDGGFFTSGASPNKVLVSGVKDSGPEKNCLIPAFCKIGTLSKAALRKGSK